MVWILTGVLCLGASLFGLYASEKQAKQKLEEVKPDLERIKKDMEEQKKIREQPTASQEELTSALADTPPLHRRYSCRRPEEGNRAGRISRQRKENQSPHLKAAGLPRQEKGRKNSSPSFILGDSLIFSRHELKCNEEKILLSAGRLNRDAIHKLVHESKEPSKHLITPIRDVTQRFPLSRLRMSRLRRDT